MTRVLVTGASGCGTSTLARALAEAHGWSWLDADDFFWLPTDPPFTVKRPRDERLALFEAALARGDAAVSGSIVGWGAPIEDSFSLVVFLTLDVATRLARLRARELARFGHVNEAFLAWAAGYDDDTGEGRSRRMHDAWLAERAHVLRLDGGRPTHELLAAVDEAL